MEIGLWALYLVGGLAGLVLFVVLLALWAPIYDKLFSTQPNQTPDLFDAVGEVADSTHELVRRIETARERDEDKEGGDGGGD